MDRDLQKIHERYQMVIENDNEKRFVTAYDVVNQDETDHMSFVFLLQKKKF